MKDLTKAIKENVGAIITAMVVFLLVANYLMNVIPEHEHKIDEYNRIRLNEFSKQFVSTLNDRVNQIDVDTFISEVKKSQVNINKANTINLRNRNENKTVNYKDKAIIESISIAGLIDLPTQFKVSREIKFRLDTMKSTSTKNGNSMIINDTLVIEKTDFAKRFKGSISFKDWLIYHDLEKQDEKPRKIDNTKIIFLNSNIDQEELDSLSKHTEINGFTFLNFSNKRYYRRNLTVDGTEFNLVLVGAVNQEAFEFAARKTDVSITITCIVLVILLFLIIPLIKPLISSSKEKLTQFDLLSTTASICICSIILTVFIFTYYFSKTGSEEIISTLSKINYSVENNINNELEQYRKGSEMISKNRNELQTEAKAVHFDIKLFTDTTAIRLKNAKIPGIIFEMNKMGYENNDITDSASFAIRKKFDDRDYFQKITKPYYDQAFSAVFSKYDNKFKLVYIKKSNDSVYNGFAYEPRFAVPVNMDKSYGYLLCNKEGRVLLHSDSSKKLNENIYSINRKPNELLRVLRGFEDPHFECDYDGDPCMFYGRKFIYGNINSLTNSSPLYLITFKKLEFENDLKIYAVVRGFIISISVALGVILLLLMYSVYFYLGNVSIFSKIHVYWIFPDKSRAAEFRFLTRINYFFCFLVILFLLLIPGNILFISLIIGINLAFFNFIFLTQRAFLIDKNSIKRTIYLRNLILILVGGVGVSFLLYFNHYPNMGLSISVFGHFFYLTILKRIKNTKTNLKKIAESQNNKKYNFSLFLTSNICYHYLLLPAIIVFSIYSNEIGKVIDYNNSSAKLKTNSIDYNLSKQKEPNSDDLILNAKQYSEPPSRKTLETADFDFFQPISNSSDIVNKLYNSINLFRILALLLGIVVLYFIIYQMSAYYTSRFFFLDLAQYATLNGFNVKHQLANLDFIIPPFSKRDLRKLEQNEIGEHNIPRDYIYPSEVNDDNLTPHKKLELIFSKSLEIHKKEYISIWYDLSANEKFVLCDFASDYFVNYKNKKHLVRLMEKGLIIIDPLTGRPRVMNYSFRNFILYYEKIDVSFSLEDEEKKIKGTFSKWKLPLIIIAVSFLILIMYINKEKYNQVLLIGGSILSTLTLVARFLNNDKK